MTAEERRYLKSAIDAHRRAAMEADGDPLFRRRPVKVEDGGDPLGMLTVAVGVWGGLVLLFALLGLGLSFS